MMNARKISDCGRAYHLPLPKRWCARVRLTARSPVLIHGEIDGRVYTWQAYIVAHARGLHVAVPPAWRRWWRLRYGSWVVVLLGDGPELTLQSVPGMSLKEWEARGWVELLEREAAAEGRVNAARAAGYAEGLATGYSLGIGAGRRMAPAVPSEDPPRG